uniref:STAS domain-containing protein n=1 Tax=Streptomyces sp. CA-141956 TaxID=3240051 RepID=UPI003F496AF3
MTVRADELLQAHTVWWGHTVLLRLDGELDIATAPLVDRTVTAVLAGRPDTVHLDLAGLGFCDMTGLHALRRLTDRIHATGTALHLAGMHPRLHYTLTLLQGLSPWTPPVLQD